ncbi:hypothetical protein QL285_016356 [Trifolium repens]|nr:hypothetical protein QL285_016356 [Trifolium repens]
MQGTAADVLQTVGHGATLTGSKPSQWRQGQWRQQIYYFPSKLKTTEFKYRFCSSGGGDKVDSKFDDVA